MAISEDRLSISEITQGEVSDFQKTVDSSISSITGAINGISSDLESTINSTLAGFEEKTSSLLDPIKKIDLPFTSQSSGILDNLLCLKIPDVDFRLPSFKLDIFKDLNYDFNIKICGESKKINPVDAALSVVDKIKNPSSFVNDLKSEAIDKLLNNSLVEKLGYFGVSNLTDCVFGDTLSGFKYRNDIFGNSLADKSKLDELLNIDGCAGDFIRDQANYHGVHRITTESILSKIAYTRNTETSDTIMAGMRSSDPGITASATSNMLSNSDNIEAVYTKTDMVSKTYYSEFQDATKQAKVDNIINGTNVDTIVMSKARLLTPLETKDDSTLSTQEKININGDSTNLFKSIAKQEVYTNDKLDTFNNIILTAELMDKSWNKDVEGNVNVYKIKNNKNMATLSQEYVNSKDVDIDNGLTGTVTTNINIAERILAANLDFKESVLV